MTTLDLSRISRAVTRNPAPSEMRETIDELWRLAADDSVAPEALPLVHARLEVLVPAYHKARAQWQANLDALREATTLTEAELVPALAPRLCAGLSAMEEGQRAGFDENAFGELTEEAIRMQEEAITAFRNALCRIALKVVDPASVPEDTDASVEALEAALEHSKALPLTLEGFHGNVECLEQAKRLHPQWIAAQERLLEKRRAQERASSVPGAEYLEELAHRRRVEDAGLTKEQANDRMHRAIINAEPMYKLIRRIADCVQMSDAGGVGILDGDAFIGVVQEAHAMVLRVEGRLQ